MHFQAILPQISFFFARDSRGSSNNIFVLKNFKKNRQKETSRTMESHIPLSSSSWPFRFPDAVSNPDDEFVKFELEYYAKKCNIFWFVFSLKDNTWTINNKYRGSPDSTNLTLLVLLWNHTKQGLVLNSKYIELIFRKAVLPEKRAKNCNIPRNLYYLV